MKRLMSILVALIFISGMAMAQDNSATVKQINDYNTANIDQSGGDVTPNRVFVDQENTNGTLNTKNRAFVTQEGQDNMLDYGVKGYNNVIRSDQSGIDNKAWIDQASKFDVDNYNNIVDLDQVGNRNRVNAVLKGDDNFIKFNQDGDDNKIVGTSPFSYNGDNSRITVDQLGDENIMKGDIHGTNQFVDVDQNGETNFAKVDITASLGWNEGYYGPRDQRVTIDQKNKDNDARVTIVGEHNRVRVEQAGADMSGDQKSRVDITGSYNNVQHYQTLDAEGGLGQGGNLAKSDIDGDNNVSFIGKTQHVGQEGVDNRAIHTVTGDDNKAFTDQDGEYNNAWVTQTGDENYAKQIQDVYPSDASYDNLAPYEANYNHSNIIQNDNNNKARTYQFGDDNFAKVTQDGGDRAFVDQGIWNQSASWNHGYTSGQFGNDNRAVIDQNSGVNNARVLQLGNHNSTNISQGTVLP